MRARPGAGGGRRARHHPGARPERDPRPAARVPPPPAAQGDPGRARRRRRATISARLRGAARANGSCPTRSSEVVDREIKRLERLSRPVARAVGRDRLARVDRRPAVGHAQSGVDLDLDGARGGARPSAPRPRGREAPGPRAPRGAQARGHRARRRAAARRPSGRRQDQHRPGHRGRDRPQARARRARRRARRGGAPRAPAHLHRRAPGPARSRASVAPARPIRSSCSTRSTSSAPAPGATRRRRSSRSSTPSRTTPSSTTTSRSRSTCRRCCSSPPRTTCANVPGPLRDRMEVIEIAGYTPGGEADDRPETTCCRTSRRTPAWRRTT